MEFKKCISLFFLVFLIPIFGTAEVKRETIYVGSKKFTENYILAEMFSQLLESHGYPVKRRFGMAGTLITYEALKEGSIDVYPEYSGTIAEIILRRPKAQLEQLKRQVKNYNLEILNPIGFSNSYAVVVRRETYEEKGIQRISDLLRHPNLHGAVDHEFTERTDGWNVLKKVYGLKNRITGMELFLGYDALYNGKVDFSLAYTTDPLIKKKDFKVLEDNLGFFPRYDAVPFVSKDLPKEIKQILDSLAGLITNEVMIDLNRRAVDGESFESVARTFLGEQGFIESEHGEELRGTIRYIALIRRIKEHLSLTFTAVFFAILFALPLSLFILRFRWLAQFVMGLAGLLQTIPSIALLTLMIPLFGIGFKPALICLFLYSILPILRNTYTALDGIDPRLITAAKGIGLYPSEIFFSVKLPLSLPVILTGIRTATIISIGTATLAAFIGAGGLGEPIVTGLALNDVHLILEGAVPAAVLAIIVDFAFSGIEKIFVKTL